METVANRSACRHVTIAVQTSRPTEFIDITDRIERLIADAGLRCGFVNIQSLHTTAAILINEHEPMLLWDFTAFLEALAPRTARYRHDDPEARTVNLTPGERSNGHAHCQALLLPSSVLLNVVDGALRLGCWQRVFLVELDGPRTRQISVLAVPSDASEAGR